VFYFKGELLFRWVHKSFPILKGRSSFRIAVTPLNCTCDLLQGNQAYVTARYESAAPGYSLRETVMHVGLFLRTVSFAIIS
jgi:hypothetical protein